MIIVPRIVAEIGTAHGGDLHRDGELIHASREAGADTAKFQLVLADEILHPRSGTVNLPGGSIALYERFVELERDDEFFARLKELCTEAGLRFLCTPFGIKSARILKRLNVDEIKIASPELNHIPLLKEVASYRKPLILSAGVATMADIAEAVSTVGHAVPLTLLHCVTSYPAPEEDYNLRVIKSLSGVLGIPVGVSDHSLDPVLVPAIATLMGAAMIEKHITLSRRDAGLDDQIALEPQDFATMVREVRSVAERLRTAERLDALELRRAELSIEGELAARFGADRVGNVLGSPVKRLAPSEQRNYGFTNRSIHALHAVTAGQTISADNAAVLRSERNLPPGIHPRYWDLIQGCKVGEDIPAGHGITWRHLLSVDTGER